MKGQRKQGNWSHAYLGKTEERQVWEIHMRSLGWLEQRDNKGRDCGT